MYQSVFYNRLPGEDQYHYYLRDDKKGIHKFQYWPTLYRLDRGGNVKHYLVTNVPPFRKIR
jgi:hypothetical protein